MALDDINRKLDEYEKNFQKEREKSLLITKILFVVLIVVIIIFILALWRFQSS
ncbi:signal transduction histidine kinase [Methanobacterium petrolearium]|nr:signal transduction histidine kinase [Methanobacterium petrolearium]